jgi:hypothetical protein
MSKLWIMTLIFSIIFMIAGLMRDEFLAGLSLSPVLICLGIIIDSNWGEK